jgi:hypothetical protein
MTVMGLILCSAVTTCMLTMNFYDGMQWHVVSELQRLSVVRLQIRIFNSFSSAHQCAVQACDTLF